MKSTNLVVGDRVTWDAPQFEGSWRKPRFAGTKRLSGSIERESYGGKTGQHTFSIRLDSGELKRVKGRNLYPNLVEYEPGPNHDIEAASKTGRSDAAKELREARALGRI